VQKFLQAIEQKNQSDVVRKNFNKLVKIQVRFQKSTSQAFDPQ
jgi:putative IMPACT (imprinted ancient) family translation regulator